MSVPSPQTGYALSDADRSRGGEVTRQRTWESHLERGRQIRLANSIIDAIDEGAIGQGSLEVVANLLVKLDGALEDIRIESTLDAVRVSTVIDTLHKVHRLATGQSTGNVLHASLDAADLEARRTELAEQLKRLGDTPT